MTESELIEMLVAKAKEIGRNPYKKDFESAEISRIKAKFGPWSRALERAGLKEPKRNKKEIKLEKRS